MNGGFRPRAGFDDGLDRAPISVFVRLTRNQVKVLEHRATLAGKSLREYLREKWEAEITRTIPAEQTRPESDLSGESVGCPPKPPAAKKGKRK